jgi:hypothetical protein
MGLCSGLGQSPDLARKVDIVERKPVPKAPRKRRIRQAGDPTAGQSIICLTAMEPDDARRRDLMTYSSYR